MAVAAALAAQQGIMTAEPRARLETLRKRKRLEELRAKAGGSQFSGIVTPEADEPERGYGAPELLERPDDPEFYDRAAEAKRQQRLASSPMAAVKLATPKVFSDIGKGIATLPIRAERGVVGAAEGTANLPRDVAEQVAVPFAMSFNPEVSGMFSEMGPTGDPATLPERFSKVYQEGGYAKQQEKLRDAPRFDFSGAKIPIPEGMDSVTGALEEGLVQFLAARGAIGKLAKGGGIAPQLGKDVAATGAAFDPGVGRLADIIDSNAVPEGPLRNYLDFLKSQPEDSPLVGRFKNMLEDLTVSSPLVAPQAAVRGVQAGVNALTAPHAPSPAPVTAVPPAAPRPAQGGPPGAGQQPPTLNATPTAPPAGASPIAVAKHDARNLYRLMKAAGVPANDIKPLLADVLQRYNGLNDSRMRLALFAREYLPQRLPKPVADAVSAQFDAFGFKELTGGGPGAGVMRSSIDELRNTQKGYLESEFDAAFGKQDLVTTKGKIRKLKSENAETIYRTQIDRQQGNLEAGRAGPEQAAARDALLQTMSRDDFFKKLPAELDFAARNEGFGGIWEYVHNRPLESAHWLQSKLGFMERGGGENAGLYRQMRRMVLNDLEEAVPGYRGARMQHGDAIGQELAVNLGRELKAASKDRIKVAEIAEQVKELPKSQQRIAALSVKEMLKNEFRATKASSRVDPVTGEPIDEQQAIITQMQKDGMLDALETVFPGSTKGPRATAAIRKVMRENEGTPSYRSDTAYNQKKQEGAVEAIRSPFNKAMRGAKEKTGYSFTIPADLIAMGTGVSPVPFPFTASKIAGDAATWASRPNPRHSASTAALLYGTPPPGVNALTAPSRASRAAPPRPPRQEVLPPSQEQLDDLLRQYDAVDPGQSPKEAERLRKKIASMQKALNQLPAPSRPPGKPEKMGMGGAKNAAIDWGVPAASGATAFAAQPEGTPIEERLAVAGLSAVATRGIMPAVRRAAQASKPVAVANAGGRWTAKQDGKWWVVRDGQGNEIGKTSTQFDRTPDEAIQTVEARRHYAKAGSSSSDQMTFGAPSGGPPKPPGGGKGKPFEFTPGFKSATRGPTEIEYAVQPNGYLEVMTVRTKPEARGQGNASTAFDEFLAAADEKGLTVHLTAEPITGAGGMSKSQLETFYKSRGFKTNSGRDKDFTVRSSLIREPKQPKPPTGRGGETPAPPPKPGQGGTNGLVGRGPPKKPPKKMSSEERELRAALTKARRLHDGARRRNVMRDNRDDLNRPFSEAEENAADRLKAYLDRQATNRARVGRVKDIGQAILKNPVTHGLAGGGALGAGIIGVNMLTPDGPPKEKPMSPGDPRHYWSTVTKDKTKMLRVQQALDEWGDWDDEVEMNGNFGRTTKDAIRAWRSRRGLSPDGPMTRSDVARLLAGPRGYQDKDNGAWRYGDGAAAPPL